MTETIPVDDHLIRTYVRQPEVFTAGRGARLHTEDGREFLDFLGGIAVSALGHAHPRLVAALTEQIGRVLHTSNLYRHPFTERVATRLARLSGLDATFFTNSGAEASECALKLCRKAQRLRGAPQRTGFVAMDGGFHGRTMGALSVTSGAKYREPFEPLVPGVTFVPRGDLAALERALTAEPAAFLIEPIQGEGGIFEHGGEFLRAARELCDRTGTLLIHDEVQCGTGRTGRFLCGDWYGVKPDVATLAKPLGAGVPIGACMVTAELRDVLRPGDHGSTFAGGPLALCAADVVLDELEHGLLDAVIERGDQLRAGLSGLQRRHPRIVELRGRGLMQGIRLDGGGPELQQALHARGVLVNCTAGDVVRFLPPYVVTAADVDQAIGRIDAALATL